MVSFAKESSPVNNFSWGNLITLSQNVSDDKLYNLLHEFRERHYSAHRMTLAVQARLPMEVLERYVVNCFSQVPNNKLPPPDLTCKDSFNTPQFRKLYYIKPVKDLQQVSHLFYILLNSIATITLNCLKKLSQYTPFFFKRWKRRKCFKH